MSQLFCVRVFHTGRIYNSFQKRGGVKFIVCERDVKLGRKQSDWPVDFERHLIFSCAFVFRLEAVKLSRTLRAQGLGPILFQALL